MTAAQGVTLSTAATAFDGIASVYDEIFTQTVIGEAQRKQVWSRLARAFPPGSRILELNCGTGADARFLAQRGRYVMGCDASARMIEVAKRSEEWDRGRANPEFSQMANEELGGLRVEEAFDGAFSNFSGLNCVSDLQLMARDLARLVKSGGHVLVCLWNRVCAAEIIWFLLHRQPKKAVRRLATETTARLGGTMIRVYYPTAGEVSQSFLPWFQLRERRAVGLFVPPSYAEQAIRKHKRVLAKLEWMDRLCCEWPIFRDAGDHMLLEFVRCNP